jgi:glutamate formiminotransferase
LADCLIECVPNFSEGRDTAIVDRISSAMGAVRGAAVLDQTSDPDHNRSVITIAAPAEIVAEALLAGFGVAVEAIDLTRHGGVHPRVGAVDVVPFVPISGVRLADCACIAEYAGAEVWTRFHVPVYLYEAAARHPDRVALENIRRPGFAGAPDFGTGRHPTAGVAVIGARKFLIAWNINLKSVHLAAAQAIARKIRFSSGGLPGVKAIGLPLASRGQTQVSINLTDFEKTPLHVVFDAVAAEAAARGIEIAGSELIGLIPQAALDLSAGHDLRWENARPGMVLERRLAEAGLLQ